MCDVVPAEQLELLIGEMRGNAKCLRGTVQSSGTVPSDASKPPILIEV